MNYIINYEDLLKPRDDPFQEQLRLHDIENFKLMGYPIPEYNQKREANIKVKKVRWIILPPGKHPFSKIMQYIEQLNKTKWLKKTVDENRLKTIYKLRSDKTEVIVGANEFDGYFIFTFPEKNIFVMDNPIYGNAIYVVAGNWEKLKQLSKLSKSEILTKYPSTKRVIHKGGWEKQLLTLLQN
jgi:hypothetical protein